MTQTSFLLSTFSDSDRMGNVFTLMEAIRNSRNISQYIIYILKSQEEHVIDGSVQIFYLFISIWETNVTPPLDQETFMFLSN